VAVAPVGDVDRVSGLFVSVSVSSCRLLVASSPSIFVITPGWMPAAAAGPPAATACANRPCGVPADVAADGGMGTASRPKLAWVTELCWISWLAMSIAKSTGIAKPRPTLPPPPPGGAAPAVGTPTRRPSQFTSAPPLLPGLIGASVWTAAVMAVAPLSAGTLTMRSSALTMPAVTHRYLARMAFCRPGSR
jgi:hypothetical protein